MAWMRAKCSAVTVNKAHHEAVSKTYGGSSVKDQLDRIEGVLAGVVKSQDEVGARLTAVEDYITNPPK